MNASVRELGCAIGPCGEPMRRRAVEPRLVLDEQTALALDQGAIAPVTAQFQSA
jgi:hypothetical protein